MSGFRKLSAADAAQIKRHLACGIGHPELASRYGVAKSLISGIATGKHWKGVEPASVMPRTANPRFYGDSRPRFGR